ncbi:HtaA domain-containing protein [Conexibacter sp. CPCC 206217]|uniref:HtaA domain-containing protein n=1 Tax=Conexibacter sp. CPCC 206217 TaxID=3064574 RepID=UPI00271DB1AC|nr:HtaA domain-containing protein [Conexibacter sp. CPCC 206217]MDO8211013.1 HtaA domain-containing protein [Conexibacter sp. CPCC 206217]
MKSLLARTVAFVVLVLVLLVPGQAAHAADPVAITEGAGLDWGLKRSWRNYITAAGTTLTDGATQNPDGTFHFPLVSGSFDTVTRATVVQFGGTAQFLGHCEPTPFERPCQLDLTMSAPRVEITEDHVALFVKMSSKPISGGDIVDYPDIELASLDVEQVAPTVTGGTTSWREIPAIMTAAGAAVFSYPVGTVLDTLSFGYRGPGGKPVGETWTEPGAPLYEPAAVAAAPANLMQSQPGRNANELVASLYQDANSVAVLDRDTLAPRALLPAVSGRLVEPVSIATDPASGAIFFGTSINDRSKGLHAYAYDGAALTGGMLDGSRVDATTDTGAGVWDAQNGRYLVVRGYAARQELWQIRRDGLGVWQASAIGVIRGINGQPVTGLFRSLAFAPGGGPGLPDVLVAANSYGGQLKRLWVDADSVLAEDLPQGRGANAVQVLRVRDGLYAIDGVGDVRFLPIFGFGAYLSLDPAGEPVRVPSGGQNVNTHRVTVAYDQNKLFLVSHQMTKVTELVSGTLRRSFVVPGVSLFSYWDDALVGASRSGDLLVRTPGRGVRSLTYRATAPAITTQPADAVVTLADVAGSATATFSAVATADPAPTVRWQWRVPGQTRWADVAAGAGVEGQATPTLRVAVGDADRGRQYRAVYANTGGELSTQAATLDVQAPPTISVQPVPVAALEGDDASFTVMPSGNPEPTVTWQRLVDGYWQAVDADSGDFAVDGGFLVVRDTRRAMSGSSFRARVVNAAGTVFSVPVTLRVDQALTAPVTFGGGHVDWGFSERWRCYVVGNVARGQIELSGGVERIGGTLASGSLCTGRNAGSEQLRFPVRGGRYDPASGRLEVALGGSVRFWGHDYHVPGNTTPQLDTRFSNLRVVADATTGTLYADAVGATMEHPEPVTRTGVALVRVDLTGVSPAPFEGGLGWNSLATTLTATGAEVFGSYPEGEPFDRLALAPRLGAPQPDPEPGPDPTPDPLPDPGSRQPTPPVPTPVPGPGPTPTPTPAPAPRAAAATPRVVSAAATTVVDPRRFATVATVVCPAAASGGCRLGTPRQARVTIGGRRYAVRVIAPQRVAAGRRAIVRVQLTKAAARRLAGRRAVVRIALTTTAGGRRTSRTVTVRITRGAARGRTRA